MKITLNRIANLLKSDLTTAHTLIPKLDITEKQNWLNIISDESMKSLKNIWSYSDKSYSLTSFAMAIVGNNKIKWNV